MTNIEKELFVKFLNRNGYVLDFSTDHFDKFTKNSIGIELCGKYHLSKGKSLEAFLFEASDSEVYRLCTDLLEYYDINDIYSKDNEYYQSIYLKCKKILENNRSENYLLMVNVDKSRNLYIKNLLIRANNDIKEGNYDSALTKARTMLEESFIKAIEAKNEIPTESGDIARLYNHFKDLYKFHQDRNTDNRINDLISGINKIVVSISNMRNTSSDSHGVGLRRIEIDEATTKLYVNAAITLSEYILSRI